MTVPIVDREICIGCGVCAEACPGVFEIREEKAWAITPEKCDISDWQEAASICPVLAIKAKEG